jgi:dihydrofolate reductase
VASTTLKSLEWRNSTLITGDVVDELVKVKRHEGRDIGMTGSVTLVRSLLSDGLLDELNLLVVPLVMGTGRRLFDGWAGEFALKLLESRTFGNGVVSLSYGSDTA